MTMDNIKLIIFDLDGTLMERYTLEIYPAVKAWFESNHGKYDLAIATNQGGVGMRYWMESGNFGNPAEFPTQQEVEARLAQIPDLLPIQKEAIFTCFMYRSKKGQWNPVPPGCERDPRWDSEGRKPNPGMLKAAMKLFNTLPEETLFVGDSPEDAQAAIKAKCRVMMSWDFFKDGG